MSGYLSREGKRFIKSPISRQFLNLINRKYINGICLSDYLVERLNFSNINTGFITQYENTSTLIKPIEDSANKNKNFNLIFNKYEMNALFSAINYTDYSNNIGVIINSTESDFEDFTNLLCVSKPLLSLCIFDNYKDLKKTINATTSIHPCFIDKHTLHYSHNFPSILEYMLNLCETLPKAPVHINISKKSCKEFISINNLLNDENLNNLQILEKLYSKRGAIYTHTKQSPLQSKILPIGPHYSNPPLL